MIRIRMNPKLIGLQDPDPDPYISGLRIRRSGSEKNIHGSTTDADPDPGSCAFLALEDG
jgi:hypothetical protein